MTSRACRIFVPLFLLVFFAAGARSLRADVGLIVETPTGPLGFFSDVGHASVWISHGCLGPRGEVQFCEQSQGIVLTSTSYWPNPGAAAIPAELFFLGSRPGPAGQGRIAWDQTLAAAYPMVDPAMGAKYLARVRRRGVRILTFTTTAEQDRRVLEQVEQSRHDYRYSYIHRNCAFYAETVLKLYLGQDFRANRILDFGIITPRALERTLHRRLRSDPAVTVRTISFKDTGAHGWRQPPRNICESAIFDPKYAIPLLFYQPHIYVAFGVCYGIDRFHANHGARTLERAAAPAGSPAWDLDPHLTTFISLTGPLPPTSLWASPEAASAADATPVPAEPTTKPAL